MPSQRRLGRGLGARVRPDPVGEHHHGGRLPVLAQVAHAVESEVESLHEMQKAGSALLGVAGHP